MNSYDLSRIFWDWSFDNPELISPNHAAIYFFAIEHCNRLGWKEKFGFPSQMTMDAIGIKKHSTYIRYFNDLVNYGFFKLIQKSHNQYSSNIISLTNDKPKKGKALSKAMLNHTAKQSETNGQSKRSIDKPKTTKPKTTKRPSESDFLEYAISKLNNVNQQNVILKYASWIENDWKDGNDKPIKNWKSKLLNTLPHLGVQQEVLFRHIDPPL